MPPERVVFEALGTTCELLAVAPGRPLEQGVAWVDEMHRRFSRFLPDSELSRLNAAAGRWVEVSLELESALRAALWAWEESAGLVHAGVLPALVAAGYGRSLREGPTTATLVAKRPPPLPEMLQVEQGRARLRPGTGIDLGGVAKGWLADRLANWLGDNCLVNLGGDLFARGAGPQGQGWPVGFGGHTLLLVDQGAATSSTLRRRWRQNGQVFHHLIDPRSGRPATSDLAQISVVAKSALEAEVVAKTALLLGSGLAFAFLACNALAWRLE